MASKHNTVHVLNKSSYIQKHTRKCSKKVIQLCTNIETNVSAFREILIERFSRRTYNYCDFPEGCILLVTIPTQRGI